MTFCRSLNVLGGIALGLTVVGGANAQSGKVFPNDSASSTPYTGTYRGEGDGGDVSAEVSEPGSDGKYPVLVNVGGPGCSGTVKGLGVPLGRVLRLETSASGERCEVQLQPLAKGQLSITESYGCRVLHGASCSFEAVVDRVKSIATTHSSTKASAVPQAAATKVSGPMLCTIQGLSEPTLYLDLDANYEFKLVSGGARPISGKWSSGTFQGQKAIILKTPSSSEERFPDLYTIYEDSIKIASSSTKLTLARRSTFPGSRSAEAYDAVCVKTDSLNLNEAVRLTRPSVKNSPTAPKAEVRPSSKSEKAAQLYINAGATICADMNGMNKARAIARSGNAYAQLPDSCVIMNRAAPTRILRESTPISGVVVIEAGKTAAMVDRNDLSLR